MKNAIMTVKTEPELKRRAKEFARNTGMSLSDVINLSLRQVVDAGQIVIKPLSVKKKTAKSLEVSLKNIKVGKNLSPVFNSATEMDSYLDSL